MDRPIDPSSRNRKKIKWFLIVVGGLALFWLGSRVLLSLLRPSLSWEEIRTAKVERGPLSATLEASGLLAPETETVLSSPIETRVLKVLKQPGSLIALGDPILELDTSAQQLEFEKLNEELALKENAKAQLNQQLARKIRENQAESEISALDLQFLQAKYKQKEKLFEKGLVSREELLAARLEVDKKQVRQRQLEETGAEETEATQTRLAGLDLEINILLKTRENLSRQLKRATTVADRSGVLTWVLSEEGATVAKGAAIAKIADLRSFKVDASISDFHASRIEANQKARIDVNGFQIPGRITKLLPAVEDGILKFEIAFENRPDYGLRSNMRAEVQVVIGEKSDVLRLKKGAAINGSGFQNLFVIQDGAAIRTRIESGFSGSDYHEIIQGLNEGDEVILTDMRQFEHLTRVPIH